MEIEAKRKAGRPKGTGNLKWPSRVDGKPTPGYQRWSAMLQRCYNPKSHIWKYYGGRGIRVCSEWRGKGGFVRFMEAMGVPSPGMTLDRWPNKDGDYTPDNCRWATMKEQAANRRPGGAIKPDSLRQQAIRAGLSYSIVYQRVKLHGWSLAQALQTPHLGRGKPIGGWKRLDPKLAPEDIQKSDRHDSTAYPTKRNVHAKSQG